jgi:hypothetical protein
MPEVKETEYRVLLVNDSETPMDFVVGVLQSKHPPKAADPRYLIANGAQGRGAGAMICGRRVFRD